MIPEPEAREAAALLMEAWGAPYTAVAIRRERTDYRGDALIAHIRANFAPLQELTEALAEVAALRKALGEAMDDLWMYEHSHCDWPKFERRYASQFAALENRNVES